MILARVALIRTLCFFDVLGYPLTISEWLAWSDQKEGTVTRAALLQEVEVLKKEGLVNVLHGRVILVGRETLIATHEERVYHHPRKLRRARKVANWLTRIQGVRFVALCNTTALSHARDASDLDFFVIARDASVWQVRGWATLPFKLFGKRPQVDVEVPDAVCLSFFIDDTIQDLSTFALSADDPYLRYWLLALLPLYDDGIGQSFWEANATLRARHPLASRWIVNPDLEQKKAYIRIPTPAFLELNAYRTQERFLPTALRQTSTSDHSVVCSPHVLKFHTQDARAGVRADYEARCKAYGVEA